MAKFGVCCTCGYEGDEETPCPKRNTAKYNFDQIHCVHWWDGPDPEGDKYLRTGKAEDRNA